MNQWLFMWESSDTDFTPLNDWVYALKELKGNEAIVRDYNMC